MKIIKFEKNQLSDDIFKILRSKKFFAVSVEQAEDGDFIYSWHTHELADENIIMGCELLRNAVINGLIEQVKE